MLVKKLHNPILKEIYRDIRLNRYPETFFLKFSITPLDGGFARNELIVYCQDQPSFLYHQKILNKIKGHGRFRCFWCTKENSLLIDIANFLSQQYKTVIKYLGLFRL